MSDWFISVNVIATNPCVNSTNINSKETNSVANRMNPTARAMKYAAKITISTANRMIPNVKLTKL